MTTPSPGPSAGRLDDPAAASLLADAPLADIALRLRASPHGLPEYMAVLCNRIEAVALRLRALLPEPDRRERLSQEAAAVERRWPDPNARPPLYGVAVGVKDIIAVDGLPTRAGSAVPAESFAMPEASVIRRLREAGALIAGKTVTTEFAYFDPGPTVNPHAPAHTPGGSSSGSAATVAAGIVPLALGSQTVGSVIRPAAFCGIVGVKPTYGRIPIDGVLPYSRSVDTLGFFAQDVRGARIAAAVLVDGWDDARTREAATRIPAIGVPDGPYLAQAEPDARAAFERQLDALRAAGYTVRNVPAFDDIASIAERHRAMTTVEFAEVHRERFRRYGALFRPQSATLMDRAPDVDAAAYAAGLAGRAELRQRVEALMGAYDIDAWASPAALGPAPRGLGATGDPAMNLPWTHAGVPTVTVPAVGAGAAGRELPLGLQLSGRHGADEDLLAWAEAVASLVGADHAARD